MPLPSSQASCECTGDMFWALAVGAAASHDERVASSCRSLVLVLRLEVTERSYCVTHGLLDKLSRVLERKVGGHIFEYVVMAAGAWVHIQKIITDVGGKLRV